MVESVSKLNNKADKLYDKIAGNSFYIFSLVTLLLITIWFILSTYQRIRTEEQNAADFDEMSEFTAHMARLAEPNTFYQTLLRRLNDSFLWESDINNIKPPSVNDEIEFCLFDSSGTRIDWPKGKTTKKRASESYLKIIKKLSHKPDLVLSKEELSIAGLFSGNSHTVYSLAQTPETLVSFQGIGLKKFGAFFETKFSDGKTGNFIAWVNTEQINNHKLADMALEFLNSKTDKNFTFCHIDLNDSLKNKCSPGKKLSKKGLKILSTPNLTSTFSIKNELFSVSDTMEGIRLVCSRVMRPPPNYVIRFFDILKCILPTIFLLVIWKNLFKVKFIVSATVHFLILVFFASGLGAIIFIAGSGIYKAEKQRSLVEDHKLKAIQILEKADKNFNFSYHDLQKQYRHMVKSLSKPNAQINEILSPLISARADENIAFAGYINSDNKYEFMAPALKSPQSGTAENKYFGLLLSISEQLLELYNSSRVNKSEAVLGKESFKAVSGKPVGGILFNRSNFQYVLFDTEETLSFIDLIIDENNIAKGCLFVIHEPRKLQLRYLELTGQTIERNTGFQLVAFPKNHIEKTAYFPRYSFILEEPLWKLHDLINQTKMSSFKSGLFGTKRVLVAGMPGHNLKDFNLFLLMPSDKIAQKPTFFDKYYFAAIAITMIFICIVTISLIKTLFYPLKKLAESIETIKSGKRSNSEIIAFTEKNKLESISTGLADFVLKTTEFTEAEVIKKHLLPTTPIANSFTDLDGFQIAKGNQEQEIYNYKAVDENTSYAFLIRSKQKDLESSLILSISKMAIKLIFEDLNVYSAYHCIKDLVEYFRINLRKSFNADILMMHIKHDDNKFFFSGCGEIKLLVVYKNKESEIIELIKSSPDSKEFYDSKNIELEIEEGMIVAAVSPAFNCINTILEIIKNYKDHENLAESIQKALPDSATRENDCASIVSIRFNKGAIQ